MVEKYFIAIVLTLGVVLLLMAISFYPGGSQYDPNAVGFDWSNNYLSNLFNAESANGMPNLARYWSISGMFFLYVGLVKFFINFSNKMHAKVAANIIKYFGVGSMVFAFLAVTPLHDLMIVIAGTLVLVSFFYIAVFIFKSRFNFLKILSIICLLLFYACNYMYFTQNDLTYLPIAQKVCFTVILMWILGLEYLTKREDFKDLK